ncbi:hypothetical protein PQC43_gp116 [Escherichia phage vB_EcoP-101114UKE3]|uniref:Uncharacterized protein n=1 Tax=Escherichia phage vB_EcoP-101114UKE3 TaxID=2865794 RepID=A0AAE7XRQ4_9CAUD|nr:hypothetical protein PQC43_gp116 [Escherichia phage vB_EcoP-101114UKE3]QZI79268.1 hypothetical protein 101114UKE3_137 [Escherichia phage vB_EcoP-101114UKE3]USM81241.1 hypothetical protein 101114BS3_114 [Escherichia phage vB_EcoP-101114BS3]
MPLSASATISFACCNVLPTILIIMLVTLMLVQVICVSLLEKV